jgi:hypothetical protein
MVCKHYRITSKMLILCTVLKIQSSKQSRDGDLSLILIMKLQKFAT